MLRELKTLGYTGQLRSVQSFMQAHKPSAAAADPFVRFETGGMGQRIAHGTEQADQQVGKAFLFALFGLGDERPQG